MTVKEIRLSGLDDLEQIHSYRVYERFLRREPMQPAEQAVLTPNREELAAVYRMLAALRGKSFGVESALGSLRQQSMTAGKLLFCFDIMQERGLIDCRVTGGKVQAALLRQSGKVDIMASSVLRELSAITEQA